MTNYFAKQRSLFSTTVTTSVDASGTSGTITLASVVGLPTDTEITLTFERVATDGVTKTPTKMERIRGTIVGSNLTSYTRAVEGIEQAHSSGSIVEYIPNAADWNNMVDGILVEHNQTGTHKAALVTTLKAAGSDVTTGTSDTTIVTPKALKDAGIDAGSATTTTFTNKRITPRVVTAANYTTDTGTSLSVATADEFTVTAQAGALKLNNPGGTPTEGQKLIVRIKDDGTARALTYDTQFRASSDLALPSTTVLSKTLYLGFIFNATDTKWDLVAVLNNF